MFTIFETLFLLAIDDEEGELLESAMNDLEPALAGAVLAELVMRKRIQIEDGRVAVVDPAATESPILDRTLYAILDTTRLRKVRYWFNTLTYEKLRSEIGHYLVEKGVLAWRKKKMVLVVPFGDTSIGNVSAKYVLKNRIREIVLASRQAELPELLLLAFMSQCDLLTLVFTRGERKLADRKIKELVGENGSGSILGETLSHIVAVAARTVN